MCYHYIIMEGALRTPLFDLQEVLSAFHRRKVLTKRELLEQTGCSSMTAWRLLRQHGYHTSYNDNARHYTLVGVPQFDEHGLWAYRDVRFSKWGSLTETIVALVEHSSAGLTAQQLQQLLHIENLKPILTRLTQRKSLTRERIDARFVYFALQRTARSGQHQQRQAQLEQAATHCALPALNDIVSLLVEIIRRPDKAPRQWARRLVQKGIRIGTRDIQAVLAHYGIGVKKGLSKS